MTDESSPRERSRQFQEQDASYRAIGRYVVEFSRLVAFMRIDLIEAIATTDSSGRLYAALTLGEATAKQIADAYFAVGAARAELDASETKILRKIRDQVNDEITRRNDFAHGDWWMSFGSNPRSLVLSRVKPSRKTHSSLDDFSSAELEAITKDVERLSTWIVDVGDACLVDFGSPEHRRRLGEYFQLDGKTVTRRPVPGLRSGIPNS